MREPVKDPLALEATALRYAARTLSPSEAAAFEALLANNQETRDALSEAVRLSAEALRVDAPSPAYGFRRIVRDRIVARTHPILWAGLGAGIVAATALFAVQFTDRPAASPVVVQAPVPAVAPEPRLSETPIAKHEEPEPVVENSDDMRKAAEIWAELSNTDHVEKTHDDEARMHQRFKNLRPSTGLDSREP